MAAWQFDFHLVPRSKVLSSFGAIPSALNSETLNTVEWWEDARLPDGYERVLTSFLPEAVHWSATTRMWGEEDGDRVEVCCEAGRVRYIFARIDVRQRSDRFLEGVLRFVAHIDAVIVTAEGFRTVEPRVDALVARVRESNAYRFVRDPKGFLESIRRGEIKIGGPG